MSNVRPSGCESMRIRSSKYESDQYTCDECPRWRCSVPLFTDAKSSVSSNLTQSPYARHTPRSWRNHHRRCTCLVFWRIGIDSGFEFGVRRSVTARTLNRELVFRCFLRVDFAGFLSSSSDRYYKAADSACSVIIGVGPILDGDDCPSRARH